MHTLSRSSISRLGYKLLSWSYSGVPITISINCVRSEWQGKRSKPCLSMLHLCWSARSNITITLFTSSIQAKLHLADGLQLAFPVHTTCQQHEASYNELCNCVIQQHQWVGVSSTNPSMLICCAYSARNRYIKEASRYLISFKIKVSRNEK